LEITTEHTLHALILGYGSIGLAVGLAVLMSSDSEKRKKTVELFCSLIIAFATIALVWVTYRNLSESEKLRQSSQRMAQGTQVLAEETKSLSNETKRMADETKRLADINIEQFKIKSYPTFFWDKPEINYQNGKLHQKYRICNKGDITAHKVRILIVEVYQNSNQRHVFKWNSQAVYKMDEPIRTFDFDVKIFRENCRTLSSERSISSKYSIEQLKYFLLFIRFWVPYDTKHRFETIGYTLRTKIKDSETKYHAQELAADDKKSLIQEHHQIASKIDPQINPQDAQTVRKFFLVNRKSDE
jgi:hypothetical protein